MTRAGEAFRRFASRLCSDETMRRLVDPVIADLQFEYADAMAHSARWRARLAVGRALVAIVRVLGHGVGQALHDALLAEDGLALRIASAAGAATAVATTVFLLIPVFAIATGAYADMPVTAATIARLLLLVIPQILVVALPIGVPIGILVSCRAPMTRRALVATGAIALAGTLAAGSLNAWVAPPANAAFRTLAFGRSEGRRGAEVRINPSGSLGYRFERHKRLAMAASEVVLAAFAICAAASFDWEGKAAAGVALLMYPFLYLPLGLLVFEHVLPIALAAWLPNIVFAIAAMLMVRLRPDTT